MKKFVFKVKDKGYYANNQPTYLWCFTDDVNKAKLYKTLNGIATMTKNRNDIVVHVVDHTVSDKEIVTDLGPLTVDSSELTDEYIPTEDEDGFYCILTDKNGNKFKSPFQRTKEVAKKKALRKFEEHCTKNSA